MSINYQFGDVDAHGALIRAQAASLESEHQAIVRDVLAAGDFWGGSGSVACQEFITQLGRNFQVIYEQANQHGSKVQSASSNMASTDSAVGPAGPDSVHGGDWYPVPCAALTAVRKNTRPRNRRRVIFIYVRCGFRTARRLP